MNEHSAIPAPGVPLSFDPTLYYSPRLKHALKSLADPALLAFHATLMKTLHGLTAAIPRVSGPIWFGSLGTEIDQLLYEADRSWEIKGKTLLLQRIDDANELVF